MSRRLNFFEFLTEMLGWLQIFISPFLAGLGIGFAIYLCIPGTTGLIIAISIAILGLILGIIWATRIWKKNGTIKFMSNLSATAELDNKEFEEEK